jgi:hypothetical protein
MSRPLTASKLRSALGETNVALAELKRLFQGERSLTSKETALVDAIARIQKVSEILQRETQLVEERKTPTLRFGSDILEHTVNFDCIKDFLQTKDQDEQT